VDFYDAKGDLSGCWHWAGTEGFVFEPAVPGICIPDAGEPDPGWRAAGAVGELHPSLVRALDLTYAPILFELDYSGISR